jgi:hypothetical protein
MLNVIKQLQHFILCHMMCYGALNEVQLLPFSFHFILEIDQQQQKMKNNII